jgi:hypothetical protein
MAAAQPMSVDEREAKEAEEFRTGPLSVLTTSVKTNSQVCSLSICSDHSHVVVPTGAAAEHDSSSSNSSSSAELRLYVL